MRKSIFFAAAMGVVALTAGFYLMGGFTGDSSTAAAGESSAKATVRDATGAKVGEAKFNQSGDHVRVRIKVESLPAGFHGFHVHAVGACTATPFTSAGGHFNPAAASHPNHAADLPVILVNGDGSGNAEVMTDRFAISDLFDADGSAVIIHASPDNYANIPVDRYEPDPDAPTLATGDAGGRIACGVIQ